MSKRPHLGNLTLLQVWWDSFVHNVERVFESCRLGTLFGIFVPTRYVTELLQTRQFSDEDENKLG